MKQHEENEKIRGMLVVKVHAKEYSRKPTGEIGKNARGVGQPVEAKPSVEEGANKVEEQILMEMVKYGKPHLLCTFNAEAKKKR